MDDRYRGNTWTKLNQLATDLNDRVIALEDEFIPTTTGDEGLDIVGWMKIDDLPGIFVLFCQCACTEEWVNKQHSVGFESWRQKLRLVVTNSSLTCIPFCYRSTNGGWHINRKIHTIVIDRVRLITLLETGYEELRQLESYEIIQRILSEKEGLF